MKPKKLGSVKDNRKNETVKKSVSKNCVKGSKKKNQIQIKNLNKLDLDILEISGRSQLKPSSKSFHSQQLKQHYKQDKEITEKRNAEKRDTEKSIQEQLELISGFSL